MYKCVPITLVTGYLGSGKTTLINNILSNDKGYKMAVIVNDIGEVNIDADLIQKGGVVNVGDDLVPLQNGCICCNLNEDLINQILNLARSQKYDHILIEASGICEPVPIVQSIIAIEEQCKANNIPLLCKLDAVVSVTDALRLVKEFNCGDTLTDNKYGDDDIEGLIIQQLEFCDIVLLNKVNEVSGEELKRVKAVIKELQPVAKIIETNFSKVDLDKILDTNMFDFERSATSAGWIRELEAENVGNRDEIIEHKHEHKHEHHHHEHHHHEHEEHNHHHDHEHCDDPDCECHHHEHDEEHEHHHDHDEDEHEHHKHGEHKCHCKGECHCGHDHNHGEEEYGIGTFVYYRRKPFDRKKFLDFINEDWRRQIIRTKGLVYFSDETEMSYLFEQAGPQKNLNQTGYWYATMPEHELKQLLEQEALLRKDWDEQYGDRMIKLVFIGQHIDKHVIIEKLDNI